MLLTHIHTFHITSKNQQQPSVNKQIMQDIFLHIWIIRRDSYKKCRIKSNRILKYIFFKQKKKKCFIQRKIYLFLLKNKEEANQTIMMTKFRQCGEKKENFLKIIMKCEITNQLGFGQSKGFDCILPLTILVVFQFFQEMKKCKNKKNKFKGHCINSCNTKAPRIHKKF